MSQPVNVQDLDISQLSDVKRQLEEELAHLTNSFTQLRSAQAKFKACVENVSEIHANNKDKTILVPMTNSLYVPGKISDPEHVIIDVGTGYYVKKTRAQATKPYQEKVEYIRGNLETLQTAIQKKEENMTMLIQIIQSKLQSAAKEQ